MLDASHPVFQRRQFAEGFQTAAESIYVVLGTHWLGYNASTCKDAGSPSATSALAVSSRAYVYQKDHGTIRFSSTSTCALLVLW